MCTLLLDVYCVDKSVRDLGERPCSCCEDCSLNGCQRTLQGYMVFETIVFTY
jgi:hypothetical protein